MIEPIRIETIKAIPVYSIRHVGEYNKIGLSFENLYLGYIKIKKI